MDKTKKTIAEMHTGYLTFISIGNTEEECLKTIGKKFRSFNEHPRLTNKQLDEYYGIHYYQLADGECICE